MMQGGGGRIWGCITYYGVGDACWIPGKVDSAAYVSQSTTGPSSQFPRLVWHGSENFHFPTGQCKDTHIVKRYPASSQITVIEWPANSPDLSPIENIWAYLKYRLDQYEEPPKTIDQLWERVQDIWTTIPIDLLHELCSCPDHTKHRIPCKHMYLVQRVYGNIQVKHCSDLVPIQRTVNNDDHLGPCLESTLSQNLSRQLEDARAESEAAKKRERDATDAEVFRESYDELRTMWIRLGLIVTNPSKRRCTARYMQRAVVTLRNAMYEVEGVNRVGAGQRRE